MIIHDVDANTITIFPPIATSTRSLVTKMIITTSVGATAAVVRIMIGIHASSIAVIKSEMDTSKALPAFTVNAALAFGASIQTLAAMIWIALHINAQVVTDHEGMRTHAFSPNTTLEPPASPVTNSTMVVVSHGINALIPA